MQETTTGQGPIAEPESWHAVGSDSIRLHRDGVSMFPPLLEAIAAARSEILLEMYWFRNDAAGTPVRDALVTAAKRGVRVRVIYDAFGCRNVPQSFWRPIDAERAGATRMFGPVTPWRKRFRLDRVFHRDHRKLIAIDGEHAFVGGINIGVEWWPHDGKTAWRDDAIELVGPTAKEVRALFWRTWRRMGGWVPNGVSSIPPEGNGAVWLIANDRRLSSRREIRRTYLQEIERARISIDIANAYFLPDREVVRALVAARRRGVPVRIMVPERSDVPQVTLAQRSLVRRLVESGIEVYAFRNSMFHAKTAAIDDFATSGSYNLDYRSWHYNMESNIAVFDRAFADSVRASFGRDLELSAPITVEYLASRPLLEKASGWLMSLIHFLL